MAHLLSVCHRGYFNCSYSPCPAVCTIYSDRHYHTFDGLEYDYHTDCQVYLLKVSRLLINAVGLLHTRVSVWLSMLALDAALKCFMNDSATEEWSVWHC